MARTRSETRKSKPDSTLNFNLDTSSPASPKLIKRPVRKYVKKVLSKPDIPLPISKSSKIQQTKNSSTSPKIFGKTPKKSYTCDFLITPQKICNYTFKSIYELKNHISRHHTKIKTHACNFCDKKFTTEAEKKRHENYVHLKFKKFNCLLCEKSFVEKCKLKRHMKVHNKPLKDEKKVQKRKSQSEEKGEKIDLKIPKIGKIEEQDSGFAEI